jgi:hypothetical protein
LRAAQGYSDGMATSTPLNSAPTTDKPPRPWRWIPLSLRMFVGILLLVGVGSLLWVGVAAFRQWRAIKEAERRGGRIGAIFEDILGYGHGPAWLRRFVDDDLMLAFEAVDEIHFEADSETSNRRIHMLTGNGRIGSVEWCSMQRDGLSIDNSTLSCITGIPGLKTLSLCLCDVSDAGMQHVARLRKLEDLDLFGTDVTDAGLASLSVLRNLQRINLSGTNVTDAGVMELQRELPKLKIER